MIVYMIYNPRKDGYLYTEKIWGWSPQDDALVFTDFDHVEYIIKSAFDTRGWRLEIHTFKLERIT